MHLFSKKAAKKMAAYQKELIETHYQEVDNMYRQMRGWRHDYRNHIQTMKAYAADENRDALYLALVLRLESDMLCYYNPSMQQSAKNLRKICGEMPGRSVTCRSSGVARPVAGSSSNWVRTLSRLPYSSTNWVRL